MTDFINYKKRKANKARKAKLLASLALFFCFITIALLFSDYINIFYLQFDRPQTVSVGVLNRKARIKNQKIVFSQISGPLINPLMGLSPWATVKQSEQPHTLVYADLSWRDLEPTEGVFDFESFEKKKQLSRWRLEGKRVVFRFVVDYPRKESHLDIPDWLFEKINGDGEYYDNSYGKGFSPNYSNPIFLNYHNLAMKALGAKYGTDPFFAFIELGSLGHWGEWHVSEELEPLPPEEIRDQYVYDYKEAFPGTFLLMRRPFSIAQKLNLGLFNDLTGHFEGTKIWLDWIQNGGSYLPNETNTILPMPEGWKIAPVGGEQATNLNNEGLYGRDLDSTLQLLRESHTTFIGPGGPYDVPSGGPLQSGIDEVISTIGYRIWIEQVEMPLVVRYAKDVQIKFSIRNDGVAPFYYPWPSQLYLFNGQGEMIRFYPTPMDIRKILPDQVYDVVFNFPLDTLGNGKYSVGYAILDPITNLPGIKLANQNPRGDLIQELGSFEIKK